MESEHNSSQTSSKDGSGAGEREDEGPDKSTDPMQQRTYTSDDPDPWEEFIGCTVVIDTPTRYVYIGTLVRRKEETLLLEDVNVHDSEESKSTKEVYIMESAQHGVRINREKVMVPEQRVLSISKLDDTVIY